MLTPYKASQPGALKIKIPSDPHVWTHREPLWFDVSQHPDGWLLLEIDLDVNFLWPNGWRAEKTRIQANVYIDNNHTWTPALGYGKCRAEWASTIITTVDGVKSEENVTSGYPALELHGGTPTSGPKRVLVNPSTTARPLELQVSVNPDLHSDPPQPGTIVLPRSSPYAAKTMIDLPPYVAGPGDRVMAMAIDRNTTRGAGAVLLVERIMG